MKSTVIIILLCSFCCACKKNIPEPDVIKMDVYATKINHTNHNEPDILYWYVRVANKGGYFYINSTRDISNFKDYKFSYSKDIPKDLLSKSPVKQIVVWINQLNGDLLFDITGKTASVPSTD
ncbi:hypothetical protein [Pedobacter aquatilis]|uniref:hypothetical protein n=1 Tax=Pedobacter aquatilis TaxID=351343 RepID=UPI0029300CC7|nr:hypothetical protein [Pedobacter aquatilis]